MYRSIDTFRFVREILKINFFLIKSTPRNCVPKRWKDVWNYPLDRKKAQLTLLAILSWEKQKGQSQLSTLIFSEIYFLQMGLKGGSRGGERGSTGEGDSTGGEGCSTGEQKVLQ